MSRRILIIANKAWEVDPLVFVLRHADARPGGFSVIEDAGVQVEVPMIDGSSKTVSPRVVLEGSGATAEVWCVRDLMDPVRRPSSTEEKARVLPCLAGGKTDPSLVVAFGTASFPDVVSYNGGVAVGAGVFVHDTYAQNPNPESRWTHDGIGKLQDCSAQPSNAAIFAALERDRAAIEARFLSVPVNPGRSAILIAAATSVALSNVNITDPNVYAWADREGLQMFETALPRRSLGSVETTHGVVRLALPTPEFVFVSGLANRLGYFPLEVAPRPYAQNLVASHNAAVALAWILPTVLTSAAETSP